MISRKRIAITLLKINENEIQIHRLNKDISQIKMEE
jgi:hypothetical protein